MIKELIEYLLESNVDFTINEEKDKRIVSFGDYKVIIDDTFFNVERKGNMSSGCRMAFPPDPARYIRNSIDLDWPKTLNINGKESTANDEEEFNTLISDIVDSCVMDKLKVVLGNFDLHESDVHNIQCENTFTHFANSLKCDVRSNVKWQLGKGDVDMPNIKLSIKRV